MDGSVTNFGETKKTNRPLYGRFHGAMPRDGVYLPPSTFETVFLSTAHTQRDLAKTITASRMAFRECGRS